MDSTMIFWENHAFQYNLTIYEAINKFFISYLFENIVLNKCKTIEPSAV